MASGLSAPAGRNFKLSSFVDQGTTPRSEVLLYLQGFVGAEVFPAVALVVESVRCCGHHAELHLDGGVRAVREGGRRLNRLMVAHDDKCRAEHIEQAGTCPPCTWTPASAVTGGSGEGSPSKASGRPTATRRTSRTCTR